MSSKLEPILDRLALRELADMFGRHEIDDSLLAELTDEGLQKIGIEKLGHRKKLLAAFREDGAVRPPAEIVSTRDPLVAWRDEPFVNDLGLSFVPIPEHMTLFCVWQLRRRDYQIHWIPRCAGRHAREGNVVLTMAGCAQSSPRRRGEFH